MNNRVDRYLVYAKSIHLYVSADTRLYSPLLGDPPRRFDRRLKSAVGLSRKQTRPRLSCPYAGKVRLVKDPDPCRSFPINPVPPAQCRARQRLSFLFRMPKESASAFPI